MERLHLITLNIDTDLAHAHLIFDSKSMEFAKNPHRFWFQHNDYTTKWIRIECLISALIALIHRMEDYRGNKNNKQQKKRLTVRNERFVSLWWILETIEQMFWMSLWLLCAIWWMLRLFRDAIQWDANGIHWWKAFYGTIQLVFDYRFRLCEWGKFIGKMVFSLSIRNRGF